MSQAVDNKTKQRLDDDPAEAETAETEEPTIDYQLRVSPDKVTVLLDCPDPLSAIMKTIKRVMADFETLSLPEYPDEDILREILENSCQPGQDLLDHPLIQGHAPVLPQDGKLAWSRNYFARGWVIDEETSVMDFWERAERRSVRRNELLVRHIHPIEGVEGLSVYGNPIPVEKTQDVRLRCGKGVSEVYEGNSTAYFADFDGRLVYNDDTVSIDEVYAVRGNVSLATGNIRHTGAVTIEGDVLAGATIVTEGDVVIKGMVEKSNIDCGGNLTVAGGILGDAEHHINVGGRVQAKYLREVTLRAGEDIEVGNEIAHSDIRTLGAVIIRGGRIAGGVTVAYGGIEVGTAGANGRPETKLAAGVDYTLGEKIAFHRARIKQLDKALAPVDAALRNAEETQKNQPRAADQIIEDLAKKRMLIGESITAEYLLIESLKERVLEHAKPQVIINREIWSGVKIRLGDFKYEVKRSIDKPRLAKLMDRRVRVVPMGDNNRPED